MKTTFCGHKAVSDKATVEQWLYSVCSELIDQGATEFYLGGYKILYTPFCLPVKGMYFRIHYSTSNNYRNKTGNYVNESRTDYNRYTSEKSKVNLIKNLDKLPKS